MPEVATTSSIIFASFIDSLRFEDISTLSSSFISNGNLVDFVVRSSSVKSSSLDQRETSSKLSVKSFVRHKPSCQRPEPPISLLIKTSEFILVVYIIIFFLVISYRIKFSFYPLLNFWSG